MGTKASFDTSGPVGAQPERWFKRWFNSVVPNPFGGREALTSRPNPFALRYRRAVVMSIKASFDTSGPVGAQPERWFKRWFNSVVPTRSP